MDRNPVINGIKESCPYAFIETVGRDWPLEGRRSGIHIDRFPRGKWGNRDTVQIKGTDPKFKMVSRIAVRKDGIIAINKDLSISLEHGTILGKLNLINHGIIRLFPSQDRF